MPTQTVSGVFIVRTPDEASLPIIFDSPHSGLDYPLDFHPAASPAAILTSCDRFVDELWGAAPSNGATLIAALFPRAYIDPNRAASDLDPELLEEPWHGEIQGSDYTRRGMGLIRRLVLPGIPLYERKLTLAEVEGRLSGYYRPYRNRLTLAIEDAVARFGAVWHCNCHSMKSHGNAMNTDAGAARPDFVLSDRHGQTSDLRFTRWLADQLTRQGYSVKINEPYQGGDLVAGFGRPAQRRNSLQIEINRALYLDESTYEKSAGFDSVVRNLTALLRALGDFVRAELSTRAG
jgi:N-formylglutamate deformylase